MKDALIAYQFASAESVRTTTLPDGRLGFVVADVGRLLKLTNINNRVKKLRARYPDRVSDIRLAYSKSDDEPRKRGEHKTERFIIVDSFLFLKLIFDSEVDEAEHYQLRVHTIVQEYETKGFVIDVQRADPVELQKAVNEFKTLFGHEPRGGVTISPRGDVVERSGGLKVTELAEFRKKIKRQKRQG